MKIRQNILVFILYSFSVAVFTPLFAQDQARLSERTLMGTARYVGMGGAMTAIGGDPSAVTDNAAGLGLYRRGEALLTLDYANFLMLPQASAVFCLPTGRLGQGILCHNIMFSYNRVQSFRRSWEMTAKNTPSLGALFATAERDMKIPFCADRLAAANELIVREYGYTNEYAFNWAMNISDRWYWGLGFRVNSVHFTSEGDYTEVFPRLNADSTNMYNADRTVLVMDGAGCSLSTGVIARPLSWLRLGLSIETPSLGSLHTVTKGTFAAMTDSLYHFYAPDCSQYSSAFHMPMHLSTSVAFQIGRYALIAVQYDYRYMKYRPDNHSLRVGFEVVPIQGLYINGGYVYEKNYSRKTLSVPIDPSLDRLDAYFSQINQQQYISGAIGFRGKHVIAQAAYQYRLQRLALCAHENAALQSLNTHTHRIVVTIGWHQN